MYYIIGYSRTILYLEIYIRDVHMAHIFTSFHKPETELNQLTNDPYSQRALIQTHGFSFMFLPWLLSQNLIPYQYHTMSNVEGDAIWIILKSSTNSTSLWSQNYRQWGEVNCSLSPLVGKRNKSWTRVHLNPIWCVKP